MSAREFVVAVVDDDPRVLESLQELLQSAGHTMHLFEDAKSLLDADAFAKVDCVVSDIGMPAIDGFELERLAMQSRPGLPVILITGRRELITGRRPSHRTRVFLLKPFSERELLDAIDQMVAISPPSPATNGKTL
jgi:FixJ family two-component response regulator